VAIRPLKTIDECRQVAVLERDIWGLEDGEDVVPPAVLIVSVKRGGILLGNFDERGALNGFVYSMPAVKDGRLTQWSHMLGVARGVREAGIGGRLKLAQREAALSAGVELIDAHFNFSKLGVVAEEYAENVYGASPSPLHAGTPTDRLIAEWRITLPHVERRIGSWGQPVIRDNAVRSAVVVNAAGRRGAWPVPGVPDLTRDDRRLLVEIPADFSDLQRSEPSLALEWRLHTREIFETCFARGYRAVDFFLSRSAGRGHYLLTLKT
jgi:chorismate synthase